MCVILSPSRYAAHCGTTPQMNRRTGAVRPAVNLRDRLGCASERRFLICDRLYRCATAGLTAPVRQQVHWKEALATEEFAKKRGASTMYKLESFPSSGILPVY